LRHSTRPRDCTLPGVEKRRLGPEQDVIKVGDDVTVDSLSGSSRCSRSNSAPARK